MGHYVTSYCKIVGDMVKYSCRKILFDFSVLSWKR